ncbi:MAG TPA: hypothetical protein VHT23_10380 [Gemmatimonadaceae bacterium]|jgi:hypothetical protein|nr:hypothetical protein [Gemmatimonadaceae bacterium]
MQKTLSVIAWLVAWTWALIAGVGGFALLIHEGPLPITNGWFAMFSGIAACPLTATLLKRYARVVVPAYVQLAVALLIFIAGRVAVVLILHRPFMRYPTMVIAIAFAVMVVALVGLRDRRPANAPFK